jgi:hypothetical protein
MGATMHVAEDTGRSGLKPARVRSPEPILASAGYVAARRQPEKRLLVAILETAVSDLQHYATALNGRGRRFYIEAKAWFASTASNGPGDFEYICQVLEFEPSAIRTRLRRWCAARRDAIEPAPPPGAAHRLERYAPPPLDGTPENAPSGREWWMRGFACMTPADAGRDDAGNKGETLPEKGLVS